MARLLEARLPPDTLLARWAGDRFVLGFYGLGRDAASHSIRAVLESVLSESFGTIDGTPMHVSFSAGVAEYPQDGTTLLDLVRSATSLVAEAKLRGRRTVLSSAWFADPDFAARPVDIAIVHPNEGLASQVLTALGVRGVRGYWVGDSTAVLSSLLRAAAGQPRLVVLWDLSMPGLDSWATLRLLHMDASLRQVRLIVLAPAEASQVSEEARRLGARAVLSGNLQFDELLYTIRHVLEAPSGPEAVESGRVV
jgi:PleD family two-component response regulator